MDRYLVIKINACGEYSAIALCQNYNEVQNIMENIDSYKNYKSDRFEVITLNENKLNFVFKRKEV